MAFATNFDKQMKKILDEKAPEYEWKLAWSPNRQPWKVDVAGCPKKGHRRLVFIENELKRDGPLENIVKVWHWARRADNKQRILLVQAFSKLFWQAKSEHRRRAIFAAERMVEDQKGKIDYKWIRMKYRPRPGRHQRIKEGGGRMVRAAQGLGRRVARLVHST
jgi:hypothetical protein